VVELASGGAFRFSHDLVRQTLYSALGPAEQRRMHGAVGGALEQLHGTRPGPVVSALAHHFAAALPGGDPAAAVRYLTLAGEAAGELAAWHEAAGYYERAADLAREHGFDAGETCDLYVSLAEQLVAIPDLQRAEAAIETADALLAAAPDRAREGRLTIARAHMRIGDALAFDDETIFDAIELFQELGDPAGEARGWGALVILNCGRSDRLKGGEAAERMLECASRAGSRALMSQAMRSMGSNFALGAAPVHVAIPRIRALIADAPDAVTKARLINNIARLETIRGRFDEGRALLAEARDVCPPGEWANLEDYLLTNGAQLELAAGNPRRAEELSRASCALLEAHGMVRYLSSEICILVDALIGIGQLEEAEAILERAKPWAALDDVDALMRQARSAARLAVARGDPEEAERLAREALAYIEAADAADEYAETLLLLAEIRLAAGDHDEVAAASAKAFAVAEARGNVVLMQQARERLGVPVPV
jgi:tetratricopeptide (TPR) repeat protein